MAARRIGKGVAVGASSLHTMYPDISEKKYPERTEGGALP